jgi:hypothetical protein
MTQRRENLQEIEIEGFLRYGAVYMGRVSVEVELPCQDHTSHGDINRFMESLTGKWILLQIEEAT